MDEILRMDSVRLSPDCLSKEKVDHAWGYLGYRLGGEPKGFRWSVESGPKYLEQVEWFDFTKPITAIVLIGYR